MMYSRLTFLLAAMFLASDSWAQCLLTGLSPTYCVNSSSSALIPPAGGGALSGPGITGTTFNPTLAGPGNHVITYSSCSTVYSVSQHSVLGITNNGNNLYLADNEVTDSLPIGFTFRFFCNEYTHFFISSNGFITFSDNQPDGCCQGEALPTYTAPYNMIAPTWTDLDPSLAGSIRYFVNGTAPYRQLMIHYNCISHENSGVYKDPVTLHILLYETTNVIEFNMSIKPIPSGTRLYNTTMGIQNDDGSLAYFVPGRNGTSNWASNSEMIRFTPGPLCITSQTTSVKETPTITAASTRSIICVKEYSKLKASGGLNYLWNTAQTATIITVTPTTTTIYSVTGTDGNGCSSSTQIQVIVNECLGIEEALQNEQNFRAYPSVNNGEFFIQAIAPVNIILSNELGQAIKKIELHEINNFKVSVDNLPAGIYFLRGDGARVHTQKIIVLKD